MTGKVKHCSPTLGIQVSLEFFTDIFIPPQFLPDGCVYDTEESVWVWKFDGNDLFMDVDEDIRFRVETLIFVDAEPVKEDGTEESVITEPCFKILADVGDQGLGLTSWWEPQAGEE
jgi:DNA-directed RNA polymerase III subunit RPC8